MGKLKSALFVDFDNLYISEPKYSEIFATQIQTWLIALSKKRVFVEKHVYLNCQRFMKYVPYFEQSGFKIFNCEPRTKLGKTSTDMELAVTATAMLYCKAEIEEYFVLSADADFLPLIKHANLLEKQTSIGTTTRKVSSCYFQSANKQYYLPQIMRAALKDIQLDPQTKQNLSVAVSKFLDKKLKQRSAVFMGDLFIDNCIAGIAIPPNKWGFKNNMHLFMSLHLDDYGFAGQYFYNKTEVKILGEHPSIEVIPLVFSIKELQVQIEKVLSTKLLSSTSTHMNEIIRGSIIAGVSIPEDCWGYDGYESLLYSMKFKQFGFVSQYFFDRKKHYIKGEYPYVEVKPLKRFTSSEGNRFVRLCTNYVLRKQKPVHYTSLITHPALEFAHFRFGFESLEHFLESLPWGQVQWRNGFMYDQTQFLVKDCKGKMEFIAKT